MSQNKIKFFLLSIISLGILVLNFYFWRLLAVSFLFFGIYAVINSLWLGSFLKKILGIEKEFEFIFGLFFLIFAITAFGAVFIVLYKIIPIFIFLILLFITAGSFFLGDEINYIFKKENIIGKKIVFKLNKLYLVFIFGCLLSLFLLFQVRTGKFILSPWEVIQPVYLYIFGLLVFLVLWFIFSNHNWRFALLFIIILSFLLHSFLPVVYQTGFGGDKWRHLAAEKWLQEGNIYSPALFGENIEWKNIGPIKIPAVFIIGNKTSYAAQWALTITFSWLFGTDVFWIDLLLGFILFSLFIPIFLFKIGQFFSSSLKALRNKNSSERQIVLQNEDKVFPLLLAFLPIIFYSFQVYGAITLPNSFGFLFFIFVLIFWLKYLIDMPRTFSGPPFGQKGETCPEKVRGKPKLLPYCIFLTLLVYFNYILYFVLLLEIGLMFFLFKNFSKNKVFITGLPLIVFCLIFFIPLLDKFSGLSDFTPQIFTHPHLILFYFINFIKKLLALSSVHPSLGVITQGNFIFTQTSKTLAKTTLFSLFSWIKWLSALIWIFIFYGFFNFRKLKGPYHKITFIFGIFLMITLANYFIGKYLMSGSILLSKRLDLAIAFLMIVPLGWGIVSFLQAKSNFMTSRAKIFFICLFLSLLSCAAYGSGPTLQVVTKDELESAKYVWQEVITNNDSNYCVLANTWPLLALEYTSSRHLTTGGFPVYQEYAQPERVQLFNNMSLNPSQRYLEKALEITNAESCYFMTEKRWWNKRDKKILERYQEISGDYKTIGDVYIFKFSK